MVLPSQVYSLSAEPRPLIPLCLHVDDLAGTAVADTEEASLDLIVDMAKAVHQEFIVGLKLPFAPDEGHIVASSRQLASLAAASIDCLTLSMKDTVRRLLIDYHVAHKPHRKRDAIPVHVARMKEGALRTVKLQQHFSMGAPGLFVAGIMPMALYGAEHFRVPLKHVSALQKKLARNSPIRPLGVPAPLALLSLPTASNPGYVAVDRPIHRWAREIWLLAVPSLYKLSHCLSGVELHRVTVVTGCSCTACTLQIIFQVA